jgi:uncharacterized protein (DUF2461 family)
LFPSDPLATRTFLEYSSADSGDSEYSKQYLLFTTLDAGIVTTPQLYTELEKRFRALAPFLDFLNAPLVQRRKRRRASETL